MSHLVDLNQSNEATLMSGSLFYERQSGPDARGGATIPGLAPGLGPGDANPGNVAGIFVGASHGGPFFIWGTLPGAKAPDGIVPRIT